MQQIAVLGYHLPQHYYSLLSGASRPCILQQFVASPYEGDLERDLCYWLFPEDVHIFDETLTHRHSFIQHELRVQSVASPNLNSQPTHFVLTSSSGWHSYCSSHLYYEKATVIYHGDGGLRSYKNYFIPKAIAIVSTHPQFKLHESLIGIYHTMRKSSASRVCYSITQDQLKMYESVVKRDDLSRFSLSKVRNNGDKLYFSPEFVWNFYISAVHFHGKSGYAQKEVVFSGMNGVESLCLYPLQNTLYCSHSQQQPLGFYLSPPNIVRLVSSIFLERQIILLSRDPNKCVFLSQLLLGLIRPFRWQFLYVPNLPAPLFEAMDSFMPYIVGVNSAYEADIIRKYGESERIIVDLDRDLVRMFDQRQYIGMPARVASWLNLCFSQELETMAPLKRQVRIKKNCIRMMLALLGDFVQPFIRTPANKATFIQEQYLKAVRKSEQVFYGELVAKTMMFRKLLEEVENLLTDNKAHESQITRQFLKLLIIARNELEDGNGREIGDYLDSKFSQILKRSNNKVTLDIQKNLLKFYNEYMKLGVQFQSFKTVVDFYQEAHVNESTKRYMSLRPVQSESKLDMSMRVSSNSSLRTSQHLCMRVFPL